MCSVCTCAVCVHVQCVYMCSVCTCAVCVHVQCVYMCSVCTCAVCVHVQCVYMCSVCTCAVCVKQSFSIRSLLPPPPPPHMLTHTPLSCVQLDCFHPSLLMHELMAKVMWNCMLTPAVQNDRTFNARADFICPTNSTLLYTLSY